jgi:hypothetical protein
MGTYRRFLRWPTRAHSNSALACVARQRLKKLRKGHYRRQAAPAAKPDTQLIFATITAPQYEDPLAFNEVDALPFDGVDLMIRNCYVMSVETGTLASVQRERDNRRD